MATPAATTINDLPEAVLANVFAFIADARTRNSLALACRRFRCLERATRAALSLRGNARDLYRVPLCFAAVADLDLSLLSPWGHELLSPSPTAPLDPVLLARRLRVAFPAVASLAVYARAPGTLRVLAPQWRGLRRVKLVRWHQRPPSSQPGEDFSTLFESCPSLSSLDLSAFYYWTEELPPVLGAFPSVAKSLSKLDLLTRSLMEGVKGDEIRAITEACPNLTDFRVVCRFDPRYIGYVGDEVLLAIAANCPKLAVLHLVDTTSFGTARGDGDGGEDGITSEDARISRAAMVEFFSGLRFLEELVLDVCQNVRDSGLALEVLGSKCPRLRALRLGHFQAVCSAIESRLDGIAVYQGLESLTIKNCFDLTDMALIAIGRGCCRLSKFHVHGCKGITVRGLRTMACLLRRSLVDVGVSCCGGLDAAASLRALEPIRDRIQRLHIDCVWGDSPNDHGFDLNEVEDHEGRSGDLVELLESEGDEERSRKKRRFESESNAMDGGFSNGFWCSNSWDRLQYLSLWIEVGELLSPLLMSGLEDCPNLEEILIKVEGDCRRQQKPAEPAFGLSCLATYPRLTKMELDCGETIGYVLTAPSGQMDLSLWERFFLHGIGILSLNELDYWPPQDRDVNQRSLSLPAAGLLAECFTLRKLFIHGTAHEHFMNFLLRIPNLRDVQLRGDYYPAPENDMSTEMRADSCCRFEDALNRRPIDD